MRNTVKFKFGFDHRVKAKLTGWEGYIVSRCQFRNGCIQYEVLPTVLKDGIEQPGRWMDEGDIEIVKPAPKPKAKAGSKTPGGPHDNMPTRNRP